MSARSASNGHSFSNGNGLCGECQNGPASAATVTICGNRLGTGDSHWWLLV